MNDILEWKGNRYSIRDRRGPFVIVDVGIHQAVFHLDRQKWIAGSPDSPQLVEGDGDHRPWTWSKNSLRMRKTTEKWIELNEPQERAKSMETIYLVKTAEKEIFGKYLTTDSKGRYVLELTNGDIQAFDSSLCEEVMPYTIKAVGVATSGVVGDFLAVEGSVKVGQLILTNKNQLLVVAKLNTKAKSASVWLEGTVFDGTPLKKPE